MSFRMVKPVKRAHPIIQFLYDRLAEQDKSVTWLSKKAGVNRNTLGFYWKGERCPTLAMSDKMLKVFGYQTGPIASKNNKHG